jgi:hypothetical protein
MGYELHITRSQANWFDDDDCPITADEWLTLAASDDSLRVIENDDNKFIITEWECIDSENDGRPFIWHGGRVSMKYPPRFAFLKMLQLARQLGGRVLGDDGELYESAEDHNPKAAH